MKCTSTPQRSGRHIQLTAWLMAILILFCLTATPCFTAMNSAPPPLTSIRVVMDDNYPPYVFKDDKGNLKGITIDQWHLWEKKTGIRVEIVATDWGVAQERMQQGEFDVIDTIFRNEKREQIYDFTGPYADLPVPLFVHKDITGIRRAKDLKGFVVAVKRGGAIIDYLASQGVVNIQQFPSYEKIVEGAKAGTVKVFTEERQPAIYFLNKMGIADQFNETEPMYSGQFHRAVLKGNSQLLQTIENGFSRITDEEYKKIDNRWMGTPLGSSPYLKYLWYLAGIIAAIVTGLLAWLRFLKRAVQKKTAELAASEEKYRELVQNSNSIILKWDRNGRVLFLNEFGQGFFGYSEAEIVGRPVTETIVPELESSGRNLESLMGQLFENPEKYDRNINENRCKDGRRVWISWSNSPIRDADGKIIGMFSIGADITAQIETDQERRRLEHQLLQAQKIESLGVLAGGIAHDFNNILTGIVGNLSLVKMMIKSVDQRASDRLDESEKAAFRASELTLQLLTFSRGGEPVRKTVNTFRLVTEAVSFCLRGSNVKSILELSENLLPLYVDEGQLNQALNNLLINATQAMPAGGTVTVRGENIVSEDPSSPAKMFVRLSIRDTGTGIPTDLQSRIFDPYFTTKPGGTGLGLASVHSIVTRHGGSISVYSEEGTGTEIVLLLPAADSTADSAGEESTYPARLTAPSGKRVLLMDDEEMIRDVAGMMLSELGYSVVATEDGAEAVALYRSAKEQGVPFDIVILDLTVPGGTGGDEAAEMILEIDPDATLVVSSGYSQDAVMADYRSHGFAGAINKPYSLDTLAAELDRVLAIAQ